MTIPFHHFIYGYWNFDGSSYPYFISVVHRFCYFQTRFACEKTFTKMNLYTPSAKFRLLMKPRAINDPLDTNNGLFCCQRSTGDMVCLSNHVHWIVWGGIIYQYQKLALIQLNLRWNRVSTTNYVQQKKMVEIISPCHNLGFYLPVK